MTVEVTRPGKETLELTTPVMCAAGTFGCGEVYRDLIQTDKIGALVTTPVSYSRRYPASGARVVPLDAGVLLHTGLPNPGLANIIKKHRNLWLILPVPIIVHVVATTVDDVRQCARMLDAENSVNAIELGIGHGTPREDAEALIKAAVMEMDKPVLVRIPMQGAFTLAEVAADVGAGALVVCAPPRGVAHDSRSGKLVGGRIYGPTVKPIVLNLVGQLARRIQDVPIIGAGGIHSKQDARDYIEAGARAVQVDSATWIKPQILETIARDLGEGIVTRQAGALPDEWHEGMGDTEADMLPQESQNDDDDFVLDDPQKA